MQKLAMAASSAALIALAGPLLAEPQAEVLHWWTAGGEAKAVGVLQEEFAEQGGTWTDMPVAGGGGDAAMTALRARVLSGNAPTAVQLKGPAIQEWYEEGVLADISDVAEAEGWADVLPASIAGHMKCDGQWCAAPVNVHRVDWIWANADVLDDSRSTASKSCLPSITGMRRSVTKRSKGVLAARIKARAAAPSAASWTSKPAPLMTLTSNIRRYGSSSATNTRTPRTSTASRTGSAACDCDRERWLSGKLR